MNCQNEKSQWCDACVADLDYEYWCTILVACVRDREEKDAKWPLKGPWFFDEYFGGELVENVGK